MSFHKSFTLLLILLITVACGPTPPPKPKVPEKPPEPPKPKLINGHIPIEANNQFEVGVKFLKAKPAEYSTQLA